MNVMLDTLAIVRRLREAGLTQEQADSIAEAVRDAASLPDISQLATGEDVKRVEVDLKRVEVDLKRVEAAMATKDGVRADIAEAQNNILRWVFVIVLGALALNLGGTAGLIRMLVPH
jgi:hypothetical protein